MSETNQKENRRRQFLKQHPHCVYCGAPATTTDHCPPRCFFEGRQWPETYEFPACEPCNREARLDEQAMAVLIRVKIANVRNEPAKSEWEKLFQGVQNNQPDLLAEWKVGSDQSCAMRATLGTRGDRMHQAGWGLINLGPLSKAMIDRFTVKLGKALYYRHNDALFNGVIYSKHISKLERDVTPAFIAEILRLAPAVGQPQRNKQSLVDQFLYRFNNSPEHGVLYAVVQFSEQFIFQLMVLRHDTAQALAALAEKNGTALPDLGRHECPLLHTRGSTVHRNSL